MNIVDDVWLPVQGHGRISLRELFSGHGAQYSRVHGNAVEKIVIYRFLLSLVHAALTVKNSEEWRALTTERISGLVSDYLEEHHAQFELYGEHPFLQMPALAAQASKDSDLGSTQYHVATGNSVLVSHKNRPGALSDAEKVVCLLQASCYGCGGKKYDKTILLSPGHTKNPSGSSGTLLGFIGYLHTMLLGESMIDTLRLNLLTDEDVKGMGVFLLGTGRPFWEHMPEGEICPRAVEYRQTYQGQLFPLDKFLLLRDDRIVMTEGIAYPGFQDGLVDPGLTFVQDSNKKEGQRVVWARSDRKPWRELNAVLAFLDTRAQLPRFISLGLDKIRLEGHRPLTVWLGGLAVSSNSGEQKVKGNNDYVESEFTFRTDSMTGSSYLYFSDLMKELDDDSKRLYAAVKGYFASLNEQKSDELAFQAAQEFWTLTEQVSGRILDASFSTEDRSRERADLVKSWQQLVRSIYDRRCPRFSPREILAWAQCRPQFKNTQTP